VGGHHWGKHRVWKIIGTCVRAIQLLPVIITQKPNLAVSHGSRAQMLTAYIGRVPSVVIFDYEFVNSAAMALSDWAFAPELISEATVPGGRGQLMKYPGLKEDVYINRLRPDPSIRAQLGLTDTDLVVTVRPPATEAHYHNAESETLLEAVLKRLTQSTDVRVVLVPRSEKQAKDLRQQWESYIRTGKILIPEKVVDGLNLIWFSDLVVSGGGTMNREAAALGVPVYSIFRGRIGAVDRYLADHGRLTLLSSVDDVHTKLVIKKRIHQSVGLTSSSATLHYIVNGIQFILEHR
jgi:predicted glycosyltransferase